tara:strand:+ start:165 stop:890 length:726 start_codon:yes stop_codon:yes gene_type:complete
MEVIKKFFLAILFYLLVSCSEPIDVSLKDFNLEEDVFSLGAELMSIDYGLYLLEEQSAKQTRLLIGVHGRESRGYEWIYPLKTIDDTETLTSFYRWNDSGCPGTSYNSLKSSIESTLQSNPGLKEVVVIGHSYGAVLTSLFSSDWANDESLTLHLIAGPLAGISSFTTLCSYEPPSGISKNVNFYEWRTRKELDGAFKDLDFDPQEIDLPGSNVRRLPETYNGRKLGHNWSISWVADEISK